MDDEMPDPQEPTQAEQDRARALIASADATAPPALRAALMEQIRAAESAPSPDPSPEAAPARPRARRRRPGTAPGRARLGRPAFAALAAAVVILVVVGVLTGGGTASPTVRGAAAIALRVPDGAAPASSGDRLDIGEGGIAFPYWQTSVGWTAVGSRSDRLGDRPLVTVVYAAAHGERVGYAIVGGAPLAVPAGRRVTRGGVAFTVLRAEGANVVTWRRAGHTCVLASRTASPTALLTLAGTRV